MSKRHLILPLICAVSFLPAEDQAETECYQLTYPSCRFDTCAGWNFYLTAEGLYWIPKEHGLIIAQNGIPGPGPQTSEVPPQSYNFRGDIERIRPGFDWGFRLGLGYNFCMDEWDTKFVWTSFKTHQNESFSGMLLNLWGHTDVPSSSGSSFIKAKWDLKYNVFDFELGRAFGAGRCFCLRPYLGVRGAWINQELEIFNEALLLNPDPGDFLSTDLTALSNFSGGGFRFGLDGRFDFCWNMSVYGLASYSLLYGNFNSDFLESASGANEIGDTVEDLVIADSRDRFHMGTSCLNLSMGIQWNRGFACDRFRVGLNLGWEQSLWFQINQMNHFQHNLEEGHLYQENGNLSLQGISFGARVDF